MQVARLRLVDSTTDETCHIIASMLSIGNAKNGSSLADGIRPGG
jgi:hypothetical protein